MKPRPVMVTIEHPAPMLLRMGRGNRLGLFAVRQRTEARIRGVDPYDLVNPGVSRLLGVPGSVRRHDGALWVPLTGPRAVPSRSNPHERIEAPLADALQILRPSEERLPVQVAVHGLGGPPFQSRVEGPLRHAKSLEARGEVPNEARDLVAEARAAATAAMLDHVARSFLHDGKHLYTRLPVPLLDQAETSVVSCAVPVRAAPPLVSHRRVQADGTSQAGWATRFPPSTVARLVSYMQGIDDGEADIDRFLSHVPYHLLTYLRGMDSSTAEGHLERVWPLVLAAELDQTPPCGREDAVGIVRAAALAVLEGNEETGPKDKRGIVESWILFIDRVARPALHDRGIPDSDAEALGSLSPGR
jgi:hypothetical protein